MIHNLIATRASILQNINRCKYMIGNEDIYNYQNEATLRIQLAEINSSIIAMAFGIDRNVYNVGMFNMQGDDDNNMTSFIDTFINNFERILMPYFDVNIPNSNINDMILDYYKTHYTLLPNKEEINNNIKTFKITCNIPDEYIFFLMNIHDAIPDIIDNRCTELISSDVVINALFPSSQFLVIRTKDETDYGSSMEYIENYMRGKLMSKSNSIQSYMIDGIISKFKSNILDNSPMFIFLGSIVR